MMKSFNIPIPNRAQVITGWTAVACSAVLASLFAFWGAIENFHEGWYHRELWRNLVLMMVQYLPWMFLPMIAGLLALWNRISGIILHVAFAIGAFWLFGFRSTGAHWIAIPILLLAVFYWCGRPVPVKWARRSLIIVPLLTAVISGAHPGWRVLTRPVVVDGSLRKIQGNGVNLTWAPVGPGWDEKEMSWYEAQRRCNFLTVDGMMLASQPVGVWRLSTVDEAVRTMIWRGRNAGGRWDGVARRAFFRITPDKEAPLWNPYSPVIYRWTADELENERAYMVAYNGFVNSVSKKVWYGCRCVK